jgi:hypothetical protein
LPEFKVALGSSVTAALQGKNAKDGTHSSAYELRIKYGF